jgi:glycosyltransferase involved in cell wall biosynthesis
MPGWGEGFGIVYLEALACGIPVVASKLDASQEIVGDFDIAITVDPHDSQDLRNGILKALNFPKGTRPKGLEVYSYEAFERQVCNLFDGFMITRRTATPRRSL